METCIRPHFAIINVFLQFPVSLAPWELVRHFSWSQLDFCGGHGPLLGPFHRSHLCAPGSPDTMIETLDAGLITPDRSQLYLQDVFSSGFQRHICSAKFGRRRVAWTAFSGWFLVVFDTLAITCPCVASVCTLCHRRLVQLFFRIHFPAI